MPLSQLVIIRHGARLDQLNPAWQSSTERPYDSPLSALGRAEALRSGVKIRALVKGSRNIVIHCSPFLRCIETSLAIAAAWDHKILLRVDCWLGEWLTLDYYSGTNPPPPMPELVATARARLFRSVDAVNAHEKEGKRLSHVGEVTLDQEWNTELLGRGGRLDEDWPEMHQRFCASFHKFTHHYNTQAEEVVILVTHAAGCNALVRAITNQPVLVDFGTCAITHAQCDSSRTMTEDSDFSFIRQWSFQAIADVSHLQDIFQSPTSTGRNDWGQGRPSSVISLGTAPNKRRSTGLWVRSPLVENVLLSESRNRLLDDSFQRSRGHHRSYSLHS